jgi:hypothetical protein
MAKIKCKGTTLKLDIASVLTTVSQLISVKPPSKRSLSYDSTTLDGGVGKTKDITGYAEADDFEGEIYWDPELAVHAAINDNIDTPADTTWQILFVNSGASTLDFGCAGIELSPAVDMADGLKASIKGELDGIPTLTV